MVKLLNWDYVIARLSRAFAGGKLDAKTVACAIRSAETCQSRPKCVVCCQNRRLCDLGGAETCQNRAKRNLQREGRTGGSKRAAVKHRKASGTKRKGAPGGPSGYCGRLRLNALASAAPGALLTPVGTGGRSGRAAAKQRRALCGLGRPVWARCGAKRKGPPGAWTALGVRRGRGRELEILGGKLQLSALASGAPWALAGSGTAAQ